MRKITRDIARAIRAGKSLTAGNTAYSHEHGTVTLHGNVIFYREGDVFRISMAVCKRWPTPTTCERVNKLICELGTARPTIGHKNFSLVVYETFGGKPISADLLTSDPVAFSAPDPHQSRNLELS